MARIRVNFNPDRPIKKRVSFQTHVSPMTQRRSGQGESFFLSEFFLFSAVGLTIASYQFLIVKYLILLAAIGVMVYILKVFKDIRRSV